MLSKIKDVKVIGEVDNKGRCKCDKVIVSRESDGDVIKKGPVKLLDNGERYAKCPECHNFVLLPSIVA